MRLDSHHRFVKDWDTKCIEMLHSCDAGEYSVLTTYGRGWGKSVNAAGIMDENSLDFLDPIEEFGRNEMKL